MLRIITMIFILVQFFSCNSTIGRYWDFNWTFLNSTDNLKVVQHLEPLISVKSERFSPNPRNVKFTEDGKLLFKVYIQGSEDYVDDFNNNAILNVKLFSNNNIVFDTTLEWKKMVFVKGEDSFGDKNQDVNYMSILIPAL